MAKKPYVPPGLIFICEETRFVIVDKSVFTEFVKGKVEPWMQFDVARGKIFESRPIKVLESRKNDVSVVTTDYTVRLDLLTRSAFRIMPDGTEYEFRGGIQTDDLRQGWIPIKGQ